MNKGLEVVIREISIHALRKEGDDAVVDVYIGTVVISIHALREEGDLPAAFRCTASRNFYPRPPQGGRPSKAKIAQAEAKISIHALREEGDPARSISGTSWSYFYPRPPRGGRP